MASIVKIINGKMNIPEKGAAQTESERIKAIWPALLIAGSLYLASIVPTINGSYSFEALWYSALSVASGYWSFEGVQRVKTKLRVHFGGTP